MKSGIYIIINLINNKIYIGSAKCFKTREIKHFNDLKLNKHHSIYLQRAYNKYGKENFSFEIVEHCDINKLIEREQNWIDFFNPEYNICKIAGSSLGRKASAESRLKMSIFQKSRNQTKETNARALELAKLACSKKVNKYSKDGVLLKEYNSLTEASLDCSGKIGFVSKIGQVCNRIRYTTLGYIWRYKDDNNILDNPKPSCVHNKIIIATLKNGEILEFKSRKEAKKELNIKNANSITLCCQGKQEKHKGIIFKYKE